MHINEQDLAGHDAAITMNLPDGGLLVIYPKFDVGGNVVEILTAFRNPVGGAADIKMTYQHMSNGPYVDIALAHGCPLKTSLPNIFGGEMMVLTSGPHFHIPNLSHVELGANKFALVINGPLRKVVAKLA